MTTASGRRARARQHALIADNLALASSIALGYQHRGLPLDDLIQVAREGLVGAASRFDPGRGATFGTFARHAIAGAVRDARRKQVVCQPKTESLSARPDSEEPDGRDDDYDTAALADYSRDPAEVFDGDDQSGRPVRQACVVGDFVQKPDDVVGRPVGRDPYLMRCSTDYPRAKQVLRALVARRTLESQLHG
jgi:RNA polymerase sigma factor (sigma-70 family)